MRSNAPAITELRLLRFHRWALLWLQWLASFLNAASAYAPLSKQATAIAHQWLGRLETVLVSIILVRAASRIRPVRTPRHSGYRRNETHQKQA